MSTRSSAMMALTCRGDASIHNFHSDRKRAVLLKQINTTAESTFSMQKDKPYRTGCRLTNEQADVTKILKSASCGSTSSENDTIDSTSLSSTTALRRLHFKSARNPKAKSSRSQSTTFQITQKVVSTAAVLYNTSLKGKVMLMNANTNTNANINTSTDSASTIITNITHTDTSETYDSLDFVDGSVQRELTFTSLEEPLLASIQDESEGIESTNVNDIELIDNSTCYNLRSDFNLLQSTESQESCFSTITDTSSRTPLIDCHKTAENEKQIFDLKHFPSNQSNSTAYNDGDGNDNCKGPDQVNCIQTQENLTRHTAVGDQQEKSGSIFASCHLPTASCGNLSTDSSSTCNSSNCIHVTSNPIEKTVCAQPKATIVVQQPTLSLENVTETLLLSNEVGGNNGMSSKYGKSCKETNLTKTLRLQNNSNSNSQTNSNNQLHQNQARHTNNTTSLHLDNSKHFEFRNGNSSQSHHRSQSVKASHENFQQQLRPSSNQFSLQQHRLRMASMPNTGGEEEYYRLRQFSITGRSVINRGDSLKSRQNRSNISITNSDSSNEQLKFPQISGNSLIQHQTGFSEWTSSQESFVSNTSYGPYKIVMLGGTAVGKSSLVSQFMTSEFLHAYDNSIDDMYYEKSVSVLLSGEESELIFIDYAHTEMMLDDCTKYYKPHGFCVIYSITDRHSFSVAQDILRILWVIPNINQKALILVANKADLARSRTVSIEEGKAMATSYNCKFIETSVCINHNVDELLVGLLSQIRLKLENPEKSRNLFRKRSSRKNTKRCTGSPINSTTNINSSSISILSNAIFEFNISDMNPRRSPHKNRGSRTSTSLKVKGLLGRVWARDSKSKSCENLHVL